MTAGPRGAAGERPSPQPASRMDRSSRRFAMALAAAAVASLLFLLWMALKIGGTTATTDVDDIGEGVASLLAAAACLSAARRQDGRVARGWLLLGLSALSWTIGEAIWCWYEVVERIPVPFPSAADAGFLLAVPLAFAGVLSFFATPAGVTSRLRAVCDALIVASGMLLSSWLTVLGPVYRSGSGSVFAQVVGLAYPVGDVLTLSAVIIVAGRTRSSTRLAFGWIGCAIAAIAVSDSAFAYLTTVGSYSTGQLFDTGWVVGYLALALAAIKPTPRRDRRPAAGDRTLVPYVPVVAATVILIVRLVHGGRLGTVDAAGVIAMLAFLVVRQVLTLRENDALARDLEHKVQTRTLQLRHSEQRMSSLIENVSDIISVIARDGTIQFISPSVRAVLGHDDAALTDQCLFDLLHPDDRLSAVAFFTDASDAAGPGRRVELRMRTRDGEWRHTETIAGEFTGDPTGGRLVLTTRDVSDQKALEHELEHQAFHDHLTGLANRALFANRVEHQLARAARTAGQLAVIFIDLDEFKTINDTLGHESGDELLREVARRLRTSSRSGDTVARLGGDEFAVLLEESDEATAIGLTERYLRALTPPVVITEGGMSISASAGIALSGPGTESVADLLRNADIAMYRAKAAGKGGFEVFRTEMHDAVIHRVALRRDLEAALEDEELVVHYQPLIELGTQRIVGFEALCRWMHPVRGLVAPNEFIPVAEETGLIVPIGRWVLREAVRQLCAWEAMTSRKLTMSVNVSGRQLASPEFVGTVAEILRTSGLEPSRLVLELTESVLLKDVDEAVGRMRALKDLGVKLAIDDFGTGFSSLSYLHRFPVDSLKIDKSFVDQIVDSGLAGELVNSIVALGSAMRLSTVAEGIEHEWQATSLEATGCQLGQGYLFGRPLPGGQAEELIRALDPGVPGSEPAGSSARAAT